MPKSVTLLIVCFVIVSVCASPLLAKAQDYINLDPNVLRLTVFSTAVGALVVRAIWRKGIPYPPAALSGQLANCTLVQGRNSTYVATVAICQVLNAPPRRRRSVGLVIR